MKKGQLILVVEDDAILQEQVSGALEDESFNVICSTSAEEAISKLDQTDPMLVLTDLRLPGADGFEVIKHVKAKSPNCPILVMTAHASIDSAVDAMRLGAFHYLQKPISVEALLVEVQQALKHGKALRDVETLRERISSEKGLGKILGDSKSISDLREIIRKVADTDSTVLITGDTGTGKELVANALHYDSNRATGPLIKVNCAALSETLLESELFGHEKGAFTGAERQRAGRFERSDGGTLFLDEISEMGIHLQAKLLRVLQGDKIERVGGETPINVDVRLIAATNRDPLQAIEEGKLRNDLYYRLNIIHIHVPTLSERRDDIPTLAESFVARYSAKYNKSISGISPELLESLCNQEWPGNVRELENSIERAVLLTRENVIKKIEIVATSPAAGETPALRSNQSAMLNLNDVEKQTILNALEAADWNKTRASEMLGIYPSSLYKKMKRFDIPQKRPQ